MSPSGRVKKANDLGQKSSKDGEPQHQPAKRVARVLVSKQGKKAARNNAHQVRKHPRQSRSRQMVEAIQQAAAEVFAQQGYARATTNKIAERAGVSVGSLYQYFPNKDSLLAGLLKHHHAQVDEIVVAGLGRLADPTTPLDDGLRQFLTELVALHQANPSLTKALSAAVLRESPAAEDAHEKNEEGHADHARQVSAVLAGRSDVRDGDHIAMAAVLGQATAQLTRWMVHDAPPGVDSASLLEEVVQLLLRYLSKSSARRQGH